VRDSITGCHDRSAARLPRRISRRQSRSPLRAVSYRLTTSSSGQPPSLPRVERAQRRRHWRARRSRCEGIPVGCRLEDRTHARSMSPHEPLRQRWLPRRLLGSSERPVPTRAIPGPTPRHSWTAARCALGAAHPTHACSAGRRCRPIDFERRATQHDSVHFKRVVHGLLLILHV
jgi:hypothetical protein